MKEVRKADLGGWLGQAHHGLPLWRAGHGAQIQVVGLQLRDRGEKGGAGQRGPREVGRRSVHLLVAPEIKGDLFADGGRPGTPLVLDGCKSVSICGYLLLCFAFLIERQFLDSEDKEKME